MKIVFDHQTFDLQQYGGISRYICELASHLARMPDCEVSVVAPLHINEYLRTVGHPVQTTACYVGGVPKVRRAARWVNNLLSPSLLAAQRPDIVHRTYYAANQQPVAGARTVLTVHDMIHERLADSLAKDPNATEKRQAVAAADHIICISECTRRDLIEIFQVDPAKTSVVYHGFDLMSGAQDDKAMRLPAQPFLLYVGQRANYKNFSGLLQAYAHAPELRTQYSLVCFGGGAFNADELAEIEQLGLSTERVQQLGGSDAVLRRLYQAAAVFVYPSLYEGFGIPPLEAMSFGCPVVCCRASSVPEVVGPAGEYFDPGSSSALIAALQSTLHDKMRRAELIRSGFDRVRQYSWKKCAEQTFEAYKRLL